MNENRNATLDIAKGISILLMTISHLDLFRNYESIMNLNEHILMLFKMPLFIFISGFLFTDKKTFKEFSISKFDGLIKPIIFLLLFSSFIYVIYYYFIEKDYIYIYIPIALNYFALWFPIILFISLIIFKSFTLIREKEHNKANVIITLIFIFLVLYFITQNSIKYPLLPFNAILYFVIILSIGYFFKKRDLFSILFELKLLFFSIFVFTICIYYSKLLKIKLNLFDNEFGLLIPTTITFITGIIIVLNISKLISKYPALSKLFVSCSKSSFYILAFHIIIGNIIIYPTLQKYFSPSIILDIITFILTILFCIIIHRLVFHTKYLKYLLLPIKSIK